MKRFQDKVILITGAGSGIGKATALSFAQEGARVVVSDVNEEEGLKTEWEMKKKFSEVSFIKCDVSQEEEVKKLIDETLSRFGGLHGAYNNAGIEGDRALTALRSVESWHKIINTNLLGVWLCMKYELQHMMKQKKGVIVNCSSIAGLVGFPESGAYVASKHGVIGLTRTAALEYARHNIRINAVCPGVIHTPMLERFAQGNENVFAEMTPMGRLGKPQEIADCVLWLSSDESSYVTGQSIVVDGGWVVQ